MTTGPGSTRVRVKYSREIFLPKLFAWYLKAAPHQWTPQINFGSWKTSKKLQYSPEKQGCQMLLSMYGLSYCDQTWGTWQEARQFNGAQYVTPQKYFSHPLFSCLLLPNPTHQTKIVTANWWGPTNTNPPGPIKLANQQVDVRLCKLAVPFTIPSIVWKKTRSNRHILTFLYPIFSCRATYWAPAFLGTCYILISQFEFLLHG
jgi:hypothetical protein